MVHHIPISALHTGGRILCRNHSFKIACLQQSSIPLLLCGRPGVRLRGTRDSRFHRHIRTDLFQCQHTFTEIQVTSLRHSADKMAIPLLIGQFHRILYPLFQCKTPRIFLIVTPRQFSRPMPCKTTTLLSRAHAVPSFQFRSLYYRTFVLHLQTQICADPLKFIIAKPQSVSYTTSKKTTEFFVFRAGRNSPLAVKSATGCLRASADSVKLRDQQLQSGWKKMSTAKPCAFCALFCCW